MVAFDLPGMEERLWLPVACLTKITPPLPEEPPVGAVVRADFAAPDVARQLWVFEHAASPNGNSWYGAGRDEAFSWADICALGNPQLLAPAPEPVALPWEFTDADAITGRVTASPWVGGNRYDVLASIRGGDILGMNATQAREMARALWTAADKADEQVRDDA